MVPGSEAQQRLQQLNPVHPGQQGDHHAQLRHPRGRQRLHREQERVSGRQEAGLLAGDDRKAAKILVYRQSTDEESFVTICILFEFQLRKLTFW